MVPRELEEGRPTLLGFHEVEAEVPSHDRHHDPRKARTRPQIHCRSVARTHQRRPSKRVQNVSGQQAIRVPVRHQPEGDGSAPQEILELEQRLDLSWLECHAQCFGGIEDEIFPRPPVGFHVKR